MRTGLDPLPSSYSCLKQIKSMKEQLKYGIVLQDKACSCGMKAGNTVILLPFRLFPYERAFF
jgi:hypothetical protein